MPTRNKLKMTNDGNRLEVFHDDGETVSEEVLLELPERRFRDWPAEAGSSDGEALLTNGEDALRWGLPKRTLTETYSFPIAGGKTGTFYVGGFYQFHSGNDDFQFGPTLGTANSAYGAHVFILLGEATVDVLTVRVTGTSIADDGTRTTSDTEDLVWQSGLTPPQYRATTKRWIGQVTLQHQSGTAKNGNYGFVSAFSNFRQLFDLKGVAVTWTGAKNVSNPDFKVIHHRNSGWTYNAGAAPTPPSHIASMSTDYSTEGEFVTGEAGSWYRSLDTQVDGSNGDEGIIVEYTPTTNDAIDVGVVHIITQREDGG